MNFKNKVVLITGASSGIGKQTAIEFTKKGANLILVARRKNKLELIASELEKFDTTILVCQCDISDKVQVKKMSNIVLEKFGTIDILVNNAGFAIYGSVSELTIDEIESQMKLKRAGASNIIMPERIGGQRMAKLVHQPDVVEFLEYILLQKSRDVSLEELSCKDLALRFVGKSIADLKVREISGANIIGLKISGARYVFNPDPNMILSRNDKLFVLGNAGQIKKLQKEMESEE